MHDSLISLYDNLKIKGLTFIIIAITGFFSLLIFGYVSGYTFTTILNGTLVWLYYSILIFLLHVLCLLIRFSNFWSYFLPFLLFYIPLNNYIQVEEILILRYFNEYAYVIANATTKIILFSVTLSILVKTIFYLKKTVTLRGNTDAKNQKESSNIGDSEDLPLLKRIIISIKERVRIHNSRITFSLIGMLLIVVLGVGSSIGTVSLNQVNKIRELNSQRVKMIDMTKLMNDNKDEATNLAELFEKMYGNDQSFQALISKIENESKITWRDITMHITIAALTIFLVQIFFHIYKYNQQQSSKLLSKIEMIELFTENGSNLNDLRNGLLSNLNENLKFEKSPTSPTEKMIDIIDKSKGFS